MAITFTRCVTVCDVGPFFVGLDKRLREESSALSSWLVRSALEGRQGMNQEIFWFFLGGKEVRSELVHL